MTDQWTSRRIQTATGCSQSTFCQSSGGEWCGVHFKISRSGIKCTHGSCLLLMLLDFEGGRVRVGGKQASERFAYGRQMNIKIFQPIVATFAEGTCKGGTT